MQWGSGSKALRGHSCFGRGTFGANESLNKATKKMRVSDSFVTFSDCPPLALHFL